MVAHTRSGVYWTTFAVAEGPELQPTPLNFRRKFIKHMVFILNAMFVALVVISVVTIADLLRYARDLKLGEHVEMYVIMFLVLYLTCCMGSFIGCCGTYRESKWLLYVYLGYLMLVLLIDITAIIWWNIENDEVLTRIRSSIRDFWMNQDASHESRWNAIQTSLECCGLNGPGDFKRPNLLPASCCRTDLLWSSSCTENISWAVGCENKLLERAKVYVNLIPIIVNLDILVAVTLMMVTIVLVCGIRRTYHLQIN